MLNYLSQLTLVEGNVLPVPRDSPDQKAVMKLELPWAHRAFPSTS
jgi:hypothetical protein